MKSFSSFKSIPNLSKKEKKLKKLPNSKVFGENKNHILVVGGTGLGKSNALIYYWLTNPDFLAKQYTKIYIFIQI